MTKMSEYKVVFVVYATIHDMLTTRDASCIVEQHMHMVDIH